MITVAVGEPVEEREEVIRLVEENEETGEPVRDPEADKEAEATLVALPVAFSDALTLPVLREEKDARPDGDGVGEKNGVKVELPESVGDTETLLLPC